MNPAFEKHLFAQKIQKEFIEGDDAQRIAFCKKYLEEKCSEPKKETTSLGFAKEATKWLMNPDIEGLYATFNDYNMTDVRPRGAPISSNMPRKEVYRQQFSVSELDMASRPGELKAKKEEALRHLLDTIIRDHFVKTVSHQNYATFTTTYTLSLGVFET